MKNRLLQEALENKSLIGVRTKSLEWGKVIIGFVIDIMDSSFTINEIDEYGVFIGYTTILKDDVITVEVDDRYQNRLAFIHENRSSFNANDQITIWKEGSALRAYFAMLVEQHLITTFYFDEDDYVTGILHKFDEDFILIKGIGHEGDEDGRSSYMIEKLIGLRYNGPQEQKIKLLYENRLRFYRDIIDGN